MASGEADTDTAFGAHGLQALQFSFPREAGDCLISGAEAAWLLLHGLQPDGRSWLTHRPPPGAPQAQLDWPSLAVLVPG